MTSLFLDLFPDMTDVLAGVGTLKGGRMGNVSIYVPTPQQITIKPICSWI